MSANSASKSVLDAVKSVSGKVDVPKVERVPGYRAPSREGQKAKTFFTNPPALKQLKTLALELDKSEQDVLREALNMYFRQHGRPEIA